MHIKEVLGMQQAEQFKMLGDTSRLRVLHLLFQRELCVCEVQALLGMSQSSASRHLHRLKAAGFLTVEKRGQWTYYRLSDDFKNSQELLYRFLEQDTFAGEVFRKDREKMLEKWEELSCEILKEKQQEK